MDQMIKEFLIDPLVAAIFALALPSAVLLWKGRGRRPKRCKWHCAVQPVFYGGPKWHRQEVKITLTLFGIKVRTLDQQGKLQWEWHATLRKKVFLVGPWRTLREGGIANGFISVQISRTGTFMCGHDYANTMVQEHSEYGVILLGQTEEDLQMAWTAMLSGTHEMRPLDETADEYELKKERQIGRQVKTGEQC
jgi:hypothetical protein